ncbi:MAG TPA: nucleoside 2-deoxyribosyltransferase, partial [Tichowtungia sp.]|nr:nucleoside 2-deoxyribosyltransferase [Tichowtungia sp.]
MDLFWRGGGSPPAEHIRHDDLTARGEKNLSDTEIYARDIRGLNESDAIIAEASAPSLGVGYELGRAEAAGKPILCLFDASGNARL